jgi:GntR family transcriptional regulator/MocR family aminotransferase
MIPFNSLISIDKASGLPIYLQIANGVIHSIRRGHLRRGLKLPGGRILADTLKIHRKTLQMALDELLAQGWLEIIPRKGTFVARDLPDIKPAKLISPDVPVLYPNKTIFTIGKNKIGIFPPTNFQHDRNLIITEGFPDIRLAPMDQLMREVRSIQKRHGSKKYYNYGNPQGSLYLREALSSFLADTRGLPISSDNIIITNGAQMGLYLTAQMLLKSGDNVIVGEPGYVAATLTLQRTGATVIRVPVDDFGIDVGAVESLCRKKKIRMVYVIPHHHHPTTVTLTPERRMRLLDMASKYKFALIEDDYDYDFHYTSGPMLPMASLDRHGNIIYIGTLSKTFVPSVRIGFIVAPVNFIQEATQLRRSIEFQGDTLMELAIAELYKNGVIANHIKKAIKIYRERRNYFCELLKDKVGPYVSFKTPEGGMAVWTKFKGVDLKKIAERASKKGLTMNDGSIYDTKTSFNASRLGFTYLNFKEQERAVEILAKCIEVATS